MPSSSWHVNNATAMWKKDTSEEWGEKITRARNHDALRKQGGCTQEISTTWLLKQDLHSDSTSWWEKFHKLYPKMKSYRQSVIAERGRMAVDDKPLIGYALPSGHP